MEQLQISNEGIYEVTERVDHLVTTYVWNDTLKRVNPSWDFPATYDEFIKIMALENIDKDLYKNKLFEYVMCHEHIIAKYPVLNKEEFEDVEPPEVVMWEQVRDDIQQCISKIKQEKNNE